MLTGVQTGLGGADILFEYIDAGQANKDAQDVAYE